MADIFVRSAHVAVTLALLSACGVNKTTQSLDEEARLLLRDRFAVARLGPQTPWAACVAAPAVSSTSEHCGEVLVPGTRRFMEVSGATRRLSESHSTDSSAQGLLIQAVAELRWRDVNAPRLTHSISLLERARGISAHDPLILGTLAAAYLELGDRDDDLSAYLHALDVTEEALARDTTLLFARFNRAVVLERLYLTRSAKKAWDEYLARERDQGWRGEALGRLSSLAAMAGAPPWPTLGRDSLVMQLTSDEVVKLVQQSPQTAREFGFSLLGEWASALLGGKARQSEATLRVARVIGSTLVDMGADQSVSMATDDIESLRGTLAIRREAIAFKQLSEGISLHADGAYDDAVQVLGRSERMLARKGSSMWRWAAFYRAASELNRSGYDVAEAILIRTLRAVTAKEPALQGKAVWARGVVELRRGNYETAAQFYRAAAPSLARAQEPENLAALSYLLTESLVFSGRMAGARAEALRGLRLLSPFRRSPYLNNHLNTVATLAYTEGLYRASLGVTEEVLLIARDLERPQVISWALQNRARYLSSLGMDSLSESDLDEAVAWADRMRPGRGRDRVRADARLELARSVRTIHPDSALKLLQDVVGSYRMLNLPNHLPNALAEAAQASLALGDSARAHALLGEAIWRIEKKGSAFQSHELRVAYAETAERVYDAMIGLELHRKRSLPALGYLVRAQLAAWGSRGAGTSTDFWSRRSLPGIIANLREDEILICYAMLPGEVGVWTGTRAGWSYRSIVQSPSAIVALTEEFTSELRARGAGHTDAQRRLFDALLGPLEAQLSGIHKIAIVPDRELSRISFAALWDNASRRYAVERFEIRTLPSIAFLRERPTHAARQTDLSLLVVGDPGAGETVPRGRAELPGAAAEARDIAHFYNRSRLLAGSSARRDSLVKELPMHAIFHFAGHSIANPDQPEMSFLALGAWESSGNDRLLAREIATLRLSNVYVAVLSACSTLNVTKDRNGMMAGLAYSFLLAGVPSTVSTLWDVTDQPTRQLQIEFHRHLSLGTPVAESLRLAQLAMLRSDDPEASAVRSWAAFVAAGN